MAVRVYRSIRDLDEALTSARRAGRSIGFVPTMGALHLGHRSLIDRSAADRKSEKGLTVVSIFVNPIQFEDKTDLDGYPRTFEADIALCEDAGANIVFAPTVAEMYPEDFSCFVDTESDATRRLCGRARPGHFRGVLTVVSKLFHIVKPTHAYFGEKDAQQLFLLRKMVRDLNMDIQIIGCPTVREADGLALSSRNKRLSEQERAAALCLRRALEAGRSDAERLRFGRDARAISDAVESAKASMSETVEAESSARLDYAEMLDAETFDAVSETTNRILLAIAAFFGETRLIDNLTADIDFGGNADESQ
ncbi:MAG: pantoate--beta-alanine ligase [Clostridiales Family XIII bacterium]|jgi:pantoate--beta-alanine ligase|nr:pantoate--beta-alanine ligase [Clostridiales Family XIII bacterium]